MTLLAAFTAFEVPILVGDLLITRNNRRDSSRKKIHRLSSNCAIGWTGFLDSADAIFSEIYMRMDVDSFKFSKFEKLITSFSKDEFRNAPVKLVGWVINREARCFRWDSRFPQSISYPESSFDGSAGGVIKNMVGGHRIYDPNQPGLRDKDRTIGSVTSIVNRLMADEMLGLLDPELAFGESFEILYFDFDLICPLAYVAGKP